MERGISQYYSSAESSDLEPTRFLGFGGDVYNDFSELPVFKHC